MQSLAALALIVIGSGLMLRRLKPGEAVQFGAGFVGLAVALTLLVTVLVSFWCSMSWWQQILLSAVVLMLWKWRRSQQPQKRKQE